MSEKKRIITKISESTVGTPEQPIDNIYLKNNIFNPDNEAMFLNNSGDLITKAGDNNELIITRELDTSKITLQGGNSGGYISVESSNTTDSETTSDTAGNVTIAAQVTESGVQKSKKMVISTSDITFDNKPLAYREHSHAYLPLDGGIMTGDNITRQNSNNKLVLSGGETSGAATLTLYGKNSSSNPGDFVLSATNPTSDSTIQLKSVTNGNTKTLCWNNDPIITNNTFTAEVNGLKSSIDINKQNIATNKQNIETNTNDIATNKQNIATHTNDISTLKNAVAANATKVATNTTDISTLLAAINNMNTILTSHSQSISSLTTSVASKANQASSCSSSSCSNMCGHG